MILGRAVSTAWAFAIAFRGARRGAGNQRQHGCDREYAD
jgi:hypothetical protein